MVRITEALVRKRAEHNEGELDSLEEVSLHQQDIEKIEYLDKWCRNLKILYLQSNLIDRIENVSRMKKLQYLNLALNNIECIENLEGCESLEKLDLTVNFVGAISSVATLSSLAFFRELYLTGNPCTDFEGYKAYVIATLPRLQWLDGKEVERSERIVANQELGPVSRHIAFQEKQYLVKRQKEKDEEERKAKRAAGADGEGDLSVSKIEPDDNFWTEPTYYTPESRKATHEHVKKSKEKDAKKDESEPVKPRRMFDSSGEPLNVNEAKIEFTLTEDEEKNCYFLEVHCFKHLDTSLIDADVQVNYARVTLKGKVFQLRLDEPVKPDSSEAKRSQTTGSLQLTMPKANGTVKPRKTLPPLKTTSKNTSSNTNAKDPKQAVPLEVDPSVRSSANLENIVKDRCDVSSFPASFEKKARVTVRENSSDFIDNPDVPPLM